MIRRSGSPTPSPRQPDVDPGLPRISPVGIRAPRIAFYSHDSFGLGHFRRNLHLAWAARRQQPDVDLLMVTGSPRATSFELPKGTRIVKLPAVTKDDAGNYVTRGLDVPLDDTVRVRKAVIRDAVLDFAPDLFVVDHTPVGLRGELLPLLGDLRHRTHARLIFGMRDVIDEPARVRSDWQRQGVYRILEALYHHVWVYGSPMTFPVEQYYSFPPSVVNKLEYRGYIGRAPLADHAVGGSLVGFANPNRPHVLCLLGGGEDGLTVARAFMDMVTQPGCVWNATLVTGPFLAREERHQLANRAANFPHVQILRFTSDVERLIAGSDAVVTMGGYNSVTEAVSYGRKTLIIPRVFPRREQWLRATAFQDLELVRCLDPATVTSETLAAATQELLSGPQPPSPAEVGLEWNGAYTFGTRVCELLSQQPGEERLNNVCETRARA